MNLLSKILSATSKIWRTILQFYRLSALRLRYPNCKFGHDVKIDRNVVVQVSDGGILEIGDGTSIKSNVVIVCKRGKLKIGDNSFIGWGTVICANDEICLGQDSLIAEYVTIRDQNHGIELSETPFRQQEMTSSPISIGCNVWLGAKATILSGVTIGSSSVIGANAVVSKNIPANSVAVGIPAKPIKTLS